MAGTWWVEEGLHVLRGARVWDGAWFAPRDLFVENGLIAALLAPGSAASARAQSHDLQGRFLVAGLSDAHVHLLGLGQQLRMPDLRQETSWDACVARVQVAARHLPEGAPVRAWGWNQERFPSRALPDGRQVEASFPGRPALLVRVDGHCAVGNRAALALGGFRAGSADPEGGKLGRDANGSLTGLVFESALDRIREAWPADPEAVVESDLRRACEEMTRRGHVACGDMGVSPLALSILARLDARGELPLAVFASVDGERPSWRDDLRQWAEPARRGKRFRVIGLKVYADGALGSRGAELLDPYADDPAAYGIPVHSSAELAERCTAAVEAGLQPQVHCIGDGAVRRVLAMFEGLRRSHPSIGLPFRMEHAQTVAQEDLPRFAKAGVAAVVQPSHFASDGEWAVDRLGPERLDRAYRWRSFLEHGALLAASADAPIEAPDPGHGLRTFVRRKTTGGAVWGASEALTPSEAMAAYTGGCAALFGLKDRCGRADLGHRAAFGVFESDPFHDE